jgi:excinuclease ABC subunit B
LEREPSRIQRHYQPVQPTFAQSSSLPASRAHKPALDEMGAAQNRAIPARQVEVDPRSRAGAFGEKIRGPHRPTYDEMGPHAERGLPAGGKAVAQPPDSRAKRHRHGRPRKTGRPGA